MAHLLGCQNISKSYGAQPLFDGVSVNLFDNERLGILGPNGSGKSTLLKIMAQLEFPDSGEYTARRGAKIAYLLQQDDYSPDSTIGQILSTSAKTFAADDLTVQTNISRAAGLFNLTPLDRTVGTLSGGWRKRVAIAEQLAKDPDVLILDEPTNHLDIEGIQLLERYLLNSSYSLVIVSHDRTFLEHVTNRTLEINRRFPNGYFCAEGTYSKFLEKREEYLESLHRQEESLANRVRNEVEWLRRGPKARGTKASARIQEAHRLINELSEYKSRSRLSASASIEFSASGRKTKRLIVADNVAKSFGDNVLFKNLSFVLSPGLRIGILGENGSGKSTLLNILAQSIPPSEGTVEYAQNLKIVLFDQERAALDKEKSLRQFLCPDGDMVIYQGRAMHVASYASRFLFRGDSLNMPLGRFSGGEQARALIAHLMLQPADVLLLDEPTNDLDIDTLEVLEESLEDFPGAVVLVTHDRLMLDRISHIMIGLDKNGDCSIYADYAQWQEARKAPKQIQTEKVKKEKPQNKAKLSYKEKKEWEQIEEIIEKAEAEVEQCSKEANDPAIAADATKLHEAYTRLKEAQDKVDALYTRWEELDNKQKGL